MRRPYSRAPVIASYCFQTDEMAWQTVGDHESARFVQMELAAYNLSTIRQVIYLEET